MRRLATAAILAGLVLCLPACGHTPESHRAAGIVPTDALAFVSLSLDPSLLQKKDLFEIGQRFPGARKLVTGNFDISRDNLLTDALRRVCLDYRTDVKPWLGSELAVALLPPVSGGSTPSTAVLIKVDDQTKAKVTLDRLTSRPCRQAGRTPEYRFINGYAVVVDERKPADGTVLLDAFDNEARRGAGGLAAVPAFANIVNRLASDRLAVGWVDTKALTKLLVSGASNTKALRGVNVSGLANCDLTSFGFGSTPGPVAFDLRATPSSLVLEGLAAGTATAPARAGATLTEALPGDTLGETTVFDLGSIARSALMCTGMWDRATASFTKSTGLDLDADVLSLLRGETVFSVGPVRPGDKLPDFAMVTAIADHAKAQTALDHIVAAIQNHGANLAEATIAGAKAYELQLPDSSSTSAVSGLLNGFEPTFALFGDRVIVATSPQYLAALAGRPAPSLGSQQDYRDAIASASGDTTSAQLLVRFGAVRSALEQVLTGHAKASFDAKVAPELAPLRDLAARTFVRDGTYRFEMRITFS